MMKVDPQFKKRSARSVERGRASLRVLTSFNAAGTTAVNSVQTWSSR
jgi:hypothetical protein